MPSKAGSRKQDSLEDFVGQIAGDDVLRVEEDFGSGYVRLKSSEAERRQASQDIRSSEDIVIEILRNARDAGARNIFLAFNKEAASRCIVCIDDGCGIPENMHERIFLPRVTSKLDSAHMDKWGVHGRGMALFSISANATLSEVVMSSIGRGTSIKVVTNTSSLPEKSDQSAFPYFEQTESGYSMRGPKNILRTAAEFAFEHKGQLNLYCGSATEIASTMYWLGIGSIPASKRVFGRLEESDVPLTQVLSLTSDPESLAEKAGALGLDISSRSARRILDEEIPPLPSMLDRIIHESFPKDGSEASPSSSAAEDEGASSIGLPRRVKISSEDLSGIAEASMEAYREIAEKYYLEPTKPRISQRGGRLFVEFDIVESDR